MRSPLNRRRFFAQAFALAPLPALLRDMPGATTGNARAAASLKLRIDAATKQHRRPTALLQSNGDETALPGQIGCFAKGLPQNQFSEVNPAAYQSLIAALRSGRSSDFDRIFRAGGRKLSNPQSANAFHLEGGDSRTFTMVPAPSIASPDCAPDMNELYWQSVCRDVPFADYERSPIIAKAAKSLGETPLTVFRGTTHGDRTGPMISQFLLKPIPYGSGQIEQRYNVPVAASDFMTTTSEWSQMQAGFLPWRAQNYEPISRYLRNGRDLAEFVHYDFAYQAYLGAALILINANAKSIHNCNQFKSGNNPYRYSTVEEGFVTFGPAEATDWMGRVTTAALKAAYFQKWQVHRRLRPEALGGLIHLSRTGVRSYPVHPALLNTNGGEEVRRTTGSWLLPQTYPEGSPIHPSYPSGHAAIAGACSVILKACFDGSMLYPACVQSSKDGTELTPCVDYSPTVNDEIDKLALNVSMGRNWAGIHFRTDSMRGLLLGEEVGISVLQDLAMTYGETTEGFTLTRFDGSHIRITPGGDVVALGAAPEPAR
jgi:hypothetical protein